MKTRILAAAVVCFTLASMRAEASLISLDSSFGAGTVTFDTATEYRWLDLTITQRFTIDQVLAQMGSGGAFQGYRLATRAEVRTFWQNAGIDIGYENQFTTGNFAPVTSLMNLMGGPLASNGNLGGGNFFDYTQGHIADPDSDLPGWYQLASLAADPDPTMTGRVDFGYFPISEEEQRHASSFTAPHGSWLVGTCDVPSISGESATPATLWPSDHSMRNVTITYDVAANCLDGNCVLSVTSNEPENGTGDGDSVHDWQVVDDRHVQLRAERAGTGTDRRYTVTITCTDAAGNQTTKSVVVVVPQRLSRGGVTSEGPTSRTIEPPRELTLTLQSPNLPVGGATLRYGLPSSAPVELSIYDAAGRRVGTLVRGTVDAGWHTATWDRNVAAGVYFARMTVNGKTLTHRLVLLR